VKRLACTLLVAAAVAAPAAAAPAGLKYQGTGGSTLAPFRVTRATTLRWSTSGGLFGGLFALKVTNRRADILDPQLVFSRARSGTVALKPGLYDLRVDALTGTSWVILVG
jgi:hypothetical protein